MELEEVVRQHTIKPDLATALDVTTAKDNPLEGDKENVLGGGIILSVLDSLTIANKGLLQHMEKIAQKLELNIRFDFMTVGGTDACNIHKAMDGVVTMTISMPTRYMHSPRLMVNLEDYRQTIALLTEFILTLTKKDIESFKAYLKG